MRGEGGLLHEEGEAVELAQLPLDVEGRGAAAVAPRAYVGHEPSALEGVDELARLVHRSELRLVRGEGWC